MIIASPPTSAFTILGIILVLAIFPIGPALLIGWVELRRLRRVRDGVRRGFEVTGTIPRAMADQDSVT